MDGILRMFIIDAVACRLNDAFGAEFEGDRAEVLGAAIADAIEAYHFGMATTLEEK